MYKRNLIDQEAWLREKTIESLKSNTFLEINDIVQIAENGNFYIVTKEVTDIKLNNNYYAKVIPINIIGNISTADKLKKPITIKFNGDVVGEINNFDGSQDIKIDIVVNDDSHNHSNETITSLDASKINTGIIDVNRLPKEVFDKCVIVRDNEERFKLSKEQVQNGDTVKVISPDNIVYKVVDDSKLNTEDGYVPYTFNVRWKNILEKPTEYKPEYHKHFKKDITDFPESLKNPNNLEIKLNGTSYIIYDGSIAKVINITPNSIGTYTSSEINQKLDTKANVHHSHNNDEIISIDASKIKTGTIDIDRLPAAALERLIVVKDDTERFRLTKSQVQNGDTVKVEQTLKMYRVINDNMLNSESGYTVYVAGRAAEVPWSGVTGKPSVYPPSSHTHTKSQITDFPESLKNPNKLVIQLNGTTSTEYDGSIYKSLNITPQGIGAQPKGNYAQEGHNHDSSYLSLNGGKLRGNLEGSPGFSIFGFDKIMNAVWNDYAEFFERGEETEPGDVIALDLNSIEERYIKATKEHNNVVGVHSDSFAHLIGGEVPQNNEDFFEYNIKKFIPVGLAGRVKCKVIGPIKRGDYITISDIPGVGVKSKEKTIECFGIALENKIDNEIGIVKILIK